MTAAASPRQRAFSLVELVIVVVIIGIIGAIAIPRLSRGSQSAADNALKGDLSVLRRAIELYAAEHDNNFPTDNTTITTQLTQYTDSTGAVSATKTGAFIFGPYIARAIPVLPVGSNKGSAAFVATLGGAAGWVYAGGVIQANLPNAEVDVSGTQYNQY